MAIVPPSGRTAPVRILTSVLLPAPFAPMRAWTSPGRTASDADFRATTAPYRLEMPDASSRRSVAVRVMTPQIKRGDAGRAGISRSFGRSSESLFARALAGLHLVEVVRGDPRD